MSNVIIVLALMLAWIGGWISAHYTIASECEKVGAFYVGKRTFQCTKITPAPTGDNKE